MIGNFLIYPSNYSQDSNLQNARNYLKSLHKLEPVQVHHGSLIIELFADNKINDNFPIVFGSPFKDGRIHNSGENISPAELGDCRGNFVGLFKKDLKLEIVMDPLRVFHVFSNLSNGIISSSFLAICHAVPSLTINKFGFHERFLRGYNIPPDTIFNEILHIRTSEQLNGEYFELKDNLFNAQDRTVYPSKTQALSVQVNELNEYMQDLGNEIEKNGADLGLSSGYDSRLLLAMLTKNRTQNYQIHSHGIKGVNLHNFEQSITKQLAGIAGKELKVVKVDSYLGLKGQDLDKAIEDNFNYFQGRNSHNMGAFTKTYALPYKREVMGNNLISFNGLGGEIFRNYYYLPQSGIDTFLFAQNNLFYRFANFLVNPDTYNDTWLGIKSKIELITGEKLGEKTSLESIRLYYSIIRMPFGDGCNHNAHNKYFHFLTPFIDSRLYRNALSLSKFIGSGGKFEGSLINLISPELASVPTHYGKTAQNAGLKQMLKETIKVLAGQKIPRKRFDNLAKNFSTQNEGGRFLNHLLKESTRFADAWKNIQVRFPEILWKNIHYEFPSMVNAAMVSLILQSFDKKIDYSR